MTTPGPITGHAGKRGSASLTGGSSEPKLVKRYCTGPKVWWCPVEDCTTEHPPRPEDETEEPA